MDRTVLLIDDEVSILDSLARFFSREGWTVLTAAEGDAGLRLCAKGKPNLIVHDLELPGLGGLELLRELRRREPDASVVVLTGHGDVPLSVRAMELGAESFLMKPPDLAHLRVIAERAFEKAVLRRENRRLRETSAVQSGLESLESSAAMADVARQVRLLAASDSTVLIEGETGTGKGWVAHILHGASARAPHPFVEINCAGLTPTFLESELFGHEKGAFTDAKERKLGLFETADRGTLFLDEIGDLAPDLQPKLLKVLESGRFRRLGGTREIEVDVRLVAATNRPLRASVKAGEFREDLYYRLAVFPVHLPPLRERGPAALEVLSHDLLIGLSRRMDRETPAISAEALQILTRHPWPGNIRELRNALERAAIVAGPAQEIRPEHLPVEVKGASRGTSDVAADPTLSLAEIERRHIIAALAHHDGNRSRTARSLGIGRRTLYDKLERYDLK
jgi:DNA-binding NtrC family response regulator